MNILLESLDVSILTILPFMTPIFYSFTFSNVSKLMTLIDPDCVRIKSFFDEMLKLQELTSSSSKAERTIE